MEPINLAEVPGPRFQQVCYICDENGDDMAKRQGACMQCNVQVCHGNWQLSWSSGLFNLLKMFVECTGVDQ